MSDTVDVVATGDVAPETLAAAPEMDSATALAKVLKRALIQGHVARGLHECCKVLDAGHAQLCILAQSCNEPNFSRLVESLSKEKNVPLFKVAEGKQLGEWVGLCKLDKTGKPRKVVNCSVAVIKDFGPNSPELEFILNSVKQAADE
eukprot:TRINITY_DN5314_c0_g1_i1.p1 TRINITY_DN5314_c0_g1~~TRINITY_DN5314_c0_g1_i1.p1  ORF type:complete len:147 (-),score=88.24 TRINITY_DN5314_c0_g1_i1:85-525(-)